MYNQAKRFAYGGLRWDRVGFANSSSKKKISKRILPAFVSLKRLCPNTFIIPYISTTYYSIK